MEESKRRKIDSTSRRVFIKQTGAVAAFGGLMSPFGSAELVAATPSKSDLVRGHVLRTKGAVRGDSVTESSREIPIRNYTDVLVCGGGPAGIAAALSAARAGASVQLIEVASCLGGVWTAGLLTKVLDSEEKTGIMAEILSEFSIRGSNVAKLSKGTVYDPEIAKLAL